MGSKFTCVYILYEINKHAILYFKQPHPMYKKSFMKVHLENMHATLEVQVNGNHQASNAPAGS